ncbi:MAG: hypothetical protein PHN84_08760 [Desulfuromonadaceae bacterium]|nr:hypothetical protein [Desulfuromonadaceae bacterium]MDD2855485.1 hypothetical protein [Desulfuromonadaceae bacterium]
MITSVTDHTSHYFGGYFHVKLMVACDIAVERRYFETDNEYNDAVIRLGTTVRFERMLQKMAVLETDVDAVRKKLLEEFDETAKHYISVPDFAPRFVFKEYLKISKKMNMRMPRV